MRNVIGTVMLCLAAAGCQVVPAGARAPSRGEQLVKIATIAPSSARVTIDGNDAGRSSNGVLWATLRRDSHHVVMVEADGYLPSAQQVRSMPSPHRDGTPTVADLTVGELLLEPNRLHPETLFFQLVPDPDVGRTANVTPPPAAAPAAAGVPAAPPPVAPTAATPSAATTPDRGAIAVALKADLKAGRIDIDEFDARMRALYPESLR